MARLALSVIIPTLDRDAAVARVLADLAPQLSPASEVLVVDQGRDPGPVRRAAAAHGFRHLAAPREGLPRARNRGLAHTTGEVVLFLDDDTRLHPGCVRAHLQAYDDPRVGGVGGQIFERSVRPNADHTVNRLDLGGRVRTNLTGGERVRVHTLKGANMSLRRAALDQVGGFDPAYGGTAFLEDADLSVRVAAAGWELWYVPEAAVDHLSEPGGGVRVGSLRRTETWRFHNTGVFARRHRGPAALLPVALTFSAIAARRSIEWGDPSAFPELVGALWRGWRYP